MLYGLALMIAGGCFVTMVAEPERWLARLANFLRDFRLHHGS